MGRARRGRAPRLPHLGRKRAQTKKGSADGSDLFLSIMGLMSSGVRTVLISRWRTGGQTSYDLVREFAQELPHTTPVDAWQRACCFRRRMISIPTSSHV